MKIKISKSQWKIIGKIAGWTKTTTYKPPKFDSLPKKNKWQGNNSENQAQIVHQNYLIEELKNYTITSLIRNKQYPEKTTIIPSENQIIISFEIPKISKKYAKPQLLENAKQEIENWIKENFNKIIPVIFEVKNQTINTTKH